ncbi:hypothetical protein DFJ74DRAFT_704497 [Hyaloraphidium curvatum]|nr:hypothetical protein DFJ74DRAFT_704497 [Hyaloraphidium curvatum]
MHPRFLLRAGAALVLLAFAIYILAPDAVWPREKSMIERAADRVRPRAVVVPCPPPAPPTPDVVMDLFTDDAMRRDVVNRLPAAGLAPATREAQALILRHQFPADCGGKTFLRASHSHGMGTQWIDAAAVLALALASDRIFVWADDAGHAFARAQRHCGLAGKWNWLCYFQPPTNCTRFADAGSTVDRGAAETDPAVGQRMRCGVPLAAWELLNRAAPGLECDEIRTWWHAQATAFLLRFNHETVASLRRIRVNDAAPEHARRGPLAKNPPALYPLPPGTISVHVRRGGHGKLPYARYAGAARRLQAQNPVRVRRQLFLATEDPSVVEEASALPEEFAVLYSKIPRSNLGGTREVATNADMGLYHLSQLTLALEADAWIGTKEGNWDRVVDGLRCVWVAKCGHPYVDVGEVGAWGAAGGRREGEGEAVAGAPPPVAPAPEAAKELEPPAKEPEPAGDAQEPAAKGLQSDGDEAPSRGKGTANPGTKEQAVEEADDGGAAGKEEGKR